VLKVIKQNDNRKQLNKHAMLNQIKIALADDHTIFRKALKEIITQKSGIQVVADAEDGEQLLSLLPGKDVDIVLLDLYMPRKNGIETLQVLQTDYPHIKVIFLSSCTDPEIVSNMLEMGIYGYLPKTADISELWESIEYASKNTLYENKLVKDTLFWQARERLKHHDEAPLLKSNPAHHQIFKLLWQEKTTQEIANELFMSVSSIEKIKQSLKEKIGVKTTIGLIKYALTQKIIYPVAEEVRMAV
jgi:DNA-binding NarL/FixJ family response regulator